MTLSPDVSKYILYSQVDMVDERQVGCNEGLGDGSRIDDHAAIAEKYDLQLIAGNFFFST